MFEVTTHVEVRDPLGGVFWVYSDGAIEYRRGGPSGYPSPGTTWDQTSAAWGEMIANLASAFGGSQRAVLQEVLPTATIDEAVQTSRHIATAGSAIPSSYRSRSWWIPPAVALGLGAVAAGAVYYWRTRA